VTAQRFQEWLKTAADQAPQGGTVNLDVADTWSALYLPGRRSADETDLYSLNPRSISHAATLGARVRR
jgi:hypothetical protein